MGKLRPFFMPEAELSYSRRQIIRLVVIGAIGIAISLCVAKFKSPKTPNIIIILADDMGYGDLFQHEQGKVILKNFDRLANEGCTYTNFHVAQSICTASRASLLTGCYPNRIGLEGAMGPDSTHGLSQQEVTIAESAKAAGYATGMAGKWHLGHLPQYLPTRHGFDEWIGLPYSNDMWPNNPDMPKRFPPLPLYVNDDIMDANIDDSDQEYLTQLYVKHAVSFIDRNHTRPFLYYLAFSMPHVPLSVGTAFQNATGAGMYADVLYEMDWAIGNILDALDRNGIADDTWIIFYSDNGPWLSYGRHAGNSGGLREGKGTVWEGGVRVPCLMRYPRHIRRASRCDRMFMSIDLLPTIAKRINGRGPTEPIDGEDVWQEICSQQKPKLEHRPYYYYYEPNRLLAIVSGDGKWKLVFPHEYRTIGARQGRGDGKPIPYEYKTIESTELYDLSCDRGETRSVAHENPHVVTRMLQEAEVARTMLGDSIINRPGAGKRMPGQGGVNTIGK